MSFINWWDMNSVDGAVVIQWGEEVATVLDIFFLHFWELCQSSLRLFPGAGLEVKFEA